ncbi:MAG: TIGR03905 family TSCPD domain-containing protein [Coriobacteriales bacterium]
MSEYSYRTKGTCSRAISFELDEDKRVHNVMFMGGCNGNLKGIAQLIEGMPAQEVIDRVAGTTCGPKRTSCPDQLACALREALGA